MRKLAAAVVVAACAGCAPWRYVYVPGERMTAVADEFPAARYPIPLVEPRGELIVGALGLLPPDPDEEVSPTLLGVRITIANTGDIAPWTLDVREQLLVLNGGKPFGPTYIDSASPALPVLVINPGEKRTVDLYYRMPDDIEGPAQVPSFQLLWRLHTGDAMAGRRTWFTRIRIGAEASRYPAYIDSATKHVLQRTP